MAYSFYELVWFFFIYSFVGWCGEVCLAAIQKRRFINRGFVSSPVCPIYGIGAVSFAVFLPELSENLFFLFLGGFILASFIEFVTGVLLEKIFHKKWWDYSKIRFNFEGYICLRYSLLWGIFAVLLILFADPFLQTVIHMLPELLGKILLWILSALLVVDCIGTGLTILGMQKKMLQVSEWSEEIGKISKLLENAITEKIRKRMEKAFPALEAGKAEKKETAETKVFAQGCSFYKLVGLFFIGAFLGDVTETIFCFVTTGVLMSRSSVVWGPFSIVWGFAIAAVTLLLYKYKDRSDSFLFGTGTLLGGAYEYLCSVFTEIVFGKIFWDYSGMPFNLGGRINLLYCFFWGIAAVVWFKKLYPKISGLIEKIPHLAGKIITWTLIIFMCCNIVVSCMALIRYDERGNDVKADRAWKTYMDEHYGDEKMQLIYPNAKMTD